MKPTEVEIQKEANNHCKQFDNEYQDRSYSDFYDGANWAISQMQPEWMSANPMSVETAAKLADTDLNLILCRFDNGQILRYNEDHPFAVLTDLLFIPQPPTK